METFNNIDCWALFLSVLAIVGSIFTYFSHDRKIKKQEARINEYQLTKLKEEEEENKKALISGNIIKKESGQRILKIYNKGKAIATNINVQGLEIREIDVYDKILPYELMNPQDYSEIRFRIIMNAPPTLKLTYTWDDEYKTGNTYTQILSL